MYVLQIVFSLTFSISKVITLPDPYGLCNKFGNESVSKCILDCKTEKVIQTCGCKDIYMKGKTV